MGAGVRAGTSQGAAGDPQPAWEEHSQYRVSGTTPSSGAVPNRESQCPDCAQLLLLQGCQGPAWLSLTAKWENTGKAPAGVSRGSQCPGALGSPAPFPLQIPEPRVQPQPTGTAGDVPLLQEFPNLLSLAVGPGELQTQGSLQDPPPQIFSHFPSASSQFLHR